MENYDFINMFDVESSIDVAEFKKAVREEHSTDLEKIGQYKQYYSMVKKETGMRPSKFEPEPGYCFVKQKYKGVEIEILKASNEAKRVVYFFKGCAYINHLTDSALKEMQRMVRLLGDVDAISVNHRIAPEHDYKDLLSDTVNGYIWLLEQGYLPENIIFIGDSSGGGAALATAMRLRDLKMELPALMILFSPWANVAMDTPSYDTYREADCMLGENGLLEYAKEVYMDQKDVHNPYVSPCYGSFENLPKTLIQVGTEERVLDDSITITEKIRKCGGEAILEVYKDMFHEFQSYYELDAAKVAWEQVVDFINVHYEKGVYIRGDK